MNETQVGNKETRKQEKREKKETREMSCDELVDDVFDDCCGTVQDILYILDLKCYLNNSIVKGMARFTAIPDHRRVDCSGFMISRVVAERTNEKRETRCFRTVRAAALTHGGGCSRLQPLSHTNIDSGEAIQVRGILAVPEASRAMIDLLNRLDVRDVAAVALLPRSHHAMSTSIARGSYA